MNRTQLIWFLPLLLLLGCVAGSPDHRPSSLISSDQALLSIYLKGSGGAESVGQMQIEELAVDIDGAWIGLDLKPIEVGFLQQNAKQLLLGVAAAPLGNHRRLRLRVGGLGDTDELQDYIILLERPLQLAKGESKCLFLDWQMVAEQPGGLKLLPRFSAHAQSKVLVRDLLYVACGEINTVYLVRIDSNEVVSSFSVPGPLADIRLQADQRRLYILSRGRRAIIVYDCLNGRLIDQFNLTASIAPQDMILSIDGTSAFVSDAAAGVVFKLDLLSGQLQAQNRIGFRPGRMVEQEDMGLLAVSSPSSNQVYVLDSRTLEVERAVAVGSKPVGLLFFSGNLYVAEKGAASVGVFDLQTGRQVARIVVDQKPDSFQKIDQVTAYLSNTGGHSLSVLSPNQSVVFRRISPLPSPTEMILSAKKRLLYVVSQDENQVTVVEPESEKIVQNIKFGTLVTSVAILE